MIDKDFKINQLRLILVNYPNYPLDIEGVILDYIGCSGASIIDIFKLNTEIYHDLFEGSNYNRGKKLLENLVDSPDALMELSEECKVRYQNIPNIIIEIQESMKRKDASSIIVSDPLEDRDLHNATVIWHISDIHFGKYNKLEQDPRQLAFTLAKMAKDHRNYQPDIVVITGDVSSIGDINEFNDFKIFCRELSMALWDENKPERILVVPGNHDITWNDDRTADKMALFASNFSDDTVCITPFGKDNALFDGGQIVIKRINKKPDTVPPFARVTYKTKKVEFLLLVSGYFSGNIPEKLITIFKTNDGQDEKLWDILRLDEGALNQEYLYHLSASLDKTEYVTLGVIHHNPIQYGVETCQNKFAPQLLETLWSKNIPILLHGHIHQSEGKGSKRPFVSGNAYPIPAPTLSSITNTGSGRGLNIHIVETVSSHTKVDTLVWPISGSMAFHIADAFVRYKIIINNEQLDILHCCN